MKVAFIGFLYGTGFNFLVALAMFWLLFLTYLNFKVMIYKLTITNLFLLTLMNCQTQKLAEDKNVGKVETPVSENDENLIYLKEGETKFLKNQQMNITFEGINADSRCPKDVNCIWQGAATASITVMTTTSRPMQIELSSINMPSKAMSKTQNIGEYHITLEQVLPYPNQKTSTTKLKGQYHIAFKIEKEIFPRIKQKIRLPLNSFLLFFL